MAGKRYYMELKINTKKIKISELKPNSWNPKLKPEEDYDVQQQYEEVVNSIRTYGLVDPILVRSSKDGKELGFYEIINGYHRFLACKDLKFTEMVVNDLGDLSDLEAKKLAIVTEEVKIPIDQVKLSHLLKEMLEDEDLDALAKGLPYSRELIESKIDLLNFDWDGMEEPQGDMNKGGDPSELNMEEVGINLLFDNEKDKILVEGLFSLIQREQKKKSVPEALVSFAKLYGKENTSNKK